MFINCSSIHFRTGLPLGAFSGDVDRITFVGGQLTPSGKGAEDNAYILNLQGNGYIDGLALTTPEGRQLDGTHALGHLINHRRPPNVYVSPFCWSDVDRISEEDKANIVRCDGSPRCLIGGRVVLYDATDVTVYGAAICAAKEISLGQELFMDYKLSKPYPKWALDWYTCG